MPLRGRRLSPCSLVVAIVTVVACQSGPRGGSGDSTPKTPSVVDTSRASPSGVARTDSVVLRTDKTQYRAGEKVTLTFENRSAASYTFNPCSRTLEREEGSAWVAFQEEGRMCTMEAWILDPHATRAGPTELPASITPGRYRIVVRMTVEGGAAPVSAVAAITDAITVAP